MEFDNIHGSIMVKACRFNNPIPHFLQLFLVISGGEPDFNYLCLLFYFRSNTIYVIGLTNI
jgi:hypothetical protein